MPEQYNEVMDMFWKYAQRGNVLTATLTGLAKMQVFQDTDGMRRLVKYVVELSSLMGMPALDELATKFPWIESGKAISSWPWLEEALKKRRFMPVQLTETPAEPWEPEVWHEQEMAIQRRLISTAKIVLTRSRSWRSSRWLTSAASSTSRPMTRHR